MDTVGSEGFKNICTLSYVAGGSESSGGGWGCGGKFPAGLAGFVAGVESLGFDGIARRSAGSMPLNSSSSDSGGEHIPHPGGGPRRDSISRLALALLITM